MLQVRSNDLSDVALSDVNSSPVIRGCRTPPLLLLLLRLQIDHLISLCSWHYYVAFTDATQAADAKLYCDPINSDPN